MRQVRGVGHEHVIAIVDSNHKGNVAEAAIALAATKLGIPVLRPLAEHTRYDMVFDLPSGLARVQCKWASRRGEVVFVNLSGFRLTSTGYVRTRYTAEEIDAVAAYCEELDESYYLPIAKIAGMRGISLRLMPTRNGQRAGLNWAADYRLGAVAQLARARDWQSRGRGFESPQLHSQTDEDQSSASTNSATASAGTWSAPATVSSS